MHSRLFALSLAALGLLALDAQAGPADTLKIATAKVRSINQGQVNLKLGLYSGAGRAKHQVEIYYVRGNERVRLHGAESTFAGTRGGFEAGIAVNLGRRSLQKARLEVVVPACKERRQDCVKAIPLNGGANLAFEGRDRFERRGSDTLLQLKVTNTGLSKTNKCKAGVTVDGRRQGGNTIIPALDPGKSHTWDVRYPNTLKGKAFEAKLMCRDMVKSDNVRKGKLQ